MASLTRALGNFFLWLRELGATVPWEQIEVDLPFPWLRPFYTAIHTKSLLPAQRLAAHWPLPQGFILNTTTPWLEIPTGTPTAHQALGWLVRHGTRDFLEQYQNLSNRPANFEDWPRASQTLYQHFNLLQNIFFHPERRYVTLDTDVLITPPTRGWVLCDFEESVLSLKNQEVYQKFAAFIEALSSTQTQLRVLARQPLFSTSQTNSSGYEGRFNQATLAVLSCQEVYAPEILISGKNKTPLKNIIFDKLMECLF